VGLLNERVFVGFGGLETMFVDPRSQVLNDLHHAVSALEHLDLERLDADERAGVLRDLDRQRTRLEARFSVELRTLAPVDQLRKLGAASVSGWLVAATGTTRRDAGRRTTLANTLAELPLVEAAMLEGEIPIEAARVIARALNPRTRDLFDIFAQASFVDAAKAKTCDQLGTDVEHWLDRHDPDGPQPDDPTTDVLYANRVGDRVAVKGDLSLGTGIPILAALDEEMAKIRAAEPRDPDGGLPYRVPANRRAQALANLVGRAAAAPGCTTRREPAFITIDTPTRDGSRVELADGSLVPVSLAERWATGASYLHLRFADPAAGMTARFVDPDGNLVADLDLGRAARYANRAQRRALAARDRGCAYPGCDRSPHACDAHHITWWEHDGPTDLDNLVLLCRFHHVLVHAGLSRIDTIDHRPVVRLIDPDQPDWIGPPMDPDWHRHPPDAGRRPTDN